MYNIMILLLKLQYISKHVANYNKENNKCTFLYFLNTTKNTEFFFVVIKKTQHLELL